MSRAIRCTCQWVSYAQLTIYIHLLLVEFSQLWIHLPSSNMSFSESTFEDDFPFSHVGYVSSLEGTFIYLPFTSILN